MGLSSARLNLSWAKLVYPRITEAVLGWHAAAAYAKAAAAEAYVLFNILKTSTFYMLYNTINKHFIANLKIKTWNNKAINTLKNCTSNYISRAYYSVSNLLSLVYKTIS